MINPTMAMIPSGYGQDKIYSILPTNGDGDLTFNRSGKAYRTDESGLVSEVAADYPRLDWTDSNCPAIMIERSGVNEIYKSEDFSHSSWAAYGSASVTANITEGPDGTLSAAKLQSDGTTDYPRISSGANLSGTTACSMYIKEHVGDNAYFYFEGTFDADGLTENRWGIRFNFGNKAIEQYLDGEGIEVDILDSDVEELDNGWFRVSVLVPSITLIRFQIMPAYSNTTPQSVFIWGAMAEEATDLSSYIRNISPTVSASRAVESIDDLTIPINSKEGVLYVEMAAMSNNGTRRDISLNGGSSASMISVGLGSTDNTIVAKVNATGDDLFDVEIPITDATRYSKIALAYYISDEITTRSFFKLFIDGVVVADEEYSPEVTGGTLTQLSFDTSSVSPVPFYGKVKDLRIYDELPTDSELQTLTS